MACAMGGPTVIHTLQRQRGKACLFQQCFVVLYKIGLLLLSNTSWITLLLSLKTSDNHPLLHFLQAQLQSFSSSIHTHDQIIILRDPAQPPRCAPTQHHARHPSHAHHPGHLADHHQNYATMWRVCGSAYRNSNTTPPSSSASSSCALWPGSSVSNTKTYRHSAQSRVGFGWTTTAVSTTQSCWSSSTTP